MENLEKQIVRIIENNSPELAAEEILRCVVGRSEQLKCDCCGYEYLELTLKANGRKLCKDCS